MLEMLKIGNDGNWYIVFDDSHTAWDWLDHFPGSCIACFGGYDNALQVTGN